MNQNHFITGTATAMTIGITGITVITTTITPLGL